MAISWDWWNQEMQKGKNFGDFKQPFQLEPEQTNRLELVSKFKKFGFRKTIKWLAFDFLSAITFGLIKERPIQEDKPSMLQNINEPDDKSQKKIIRVETPEEDEDASNKKYVDDKFTGKFSGSWTNNETDTVTVVNGLITDVS